MKFAIGLAVGCVATALIELLIIGRGRSQHAPQEATTQAGTSQATGDRDTAPSAEPNYETLSAMASKKIISDYLKSPASARFSDQHIAEREGDFIRASAVVDASNAMGVQVRSTWCTVFKLSGPNHDDVEWNRGLSAWDCATDYSPKSILNRKASVGWPGAGEELMKRILGAKESESLNAYASKVADHTHFSKEAVLFAFDQFVLSGVPSSRMDAFVAASLDAATEAPDTEEAFRRAAYALAQFRKTKRASEQILSDLHLGPDEFRVLPRFKSMPPERLAAVIDRGVFDEAEILSAIAGEKNMLGNKWENAHQQVR